MEETSFKLGQWTSGLNLISWDISFNLTKIVLLVEWIIQLERLPCDIISVCWHWTYSFIFIALISQLPPLSPKKLLAICAVVDHIWAAHLVPLHGRWWWESKGTHTPNATFPRHYHGRQWWLITPLNLALFLGWHWGGGIGVGRDTLRFPWWFSCNSTTKACSNGTTIQRHFANQSIKQLLLFITHGAVDVSSRGKRIWSFFGFEI